MLSHMPSKLIVFKETHVTVYFPYYLPFSKQLNGISRRCAQIVFQAVAISCDTNCEHNKMQAFSMYVLCASI